MMARLSAPKSKLGTPRSLSKLGQVKGMNGQRRSDGPVNTAAWQKLRMKILRRDAVEIHDRPHLMPTHLLFKDNPWLWPQCQVTGTVLVGKYPAPDSPVVDHITPHRGDLSLFWDEKNLQTVSKAYHDKVKQSLEARGLA